VQPGPPELLGLTARRIIGVDAARAVALVGMFVAHILPLNTADGGPTMAGLLVERSTRPRTPRSGRGARHARLGLRRTLESRSSQKTSSVIELMFEQRMARGSDRICSAGAAKPPVGLLGPSRGCGSCWRAARSAEFAHDGLRPRKLPQVTKSSRILLPSA
jgi:hypothetical protein